MLPYLLYILDSFLCKTCFSDLCKALSPGFFSASMHTLVWAAATVVHQDSALNFLTSLVIFGDPLVRSFGSLRDLFSGCKFSQ